MRKGKLMRVGRVIIALAVIIASSGSSLAGVFVPQVANAALDNKPIVIFLPGIMGSELYEVYENTTTQFSGQKYSVLKSWPAGFETYPNLDGVMHLSMNDLGYSNRSDIYVGGLINLEDHNYNGIKSELNKMKANGDIFDWIDFPYDWRMYHQDIVSGVTRRVGSDSQGNINVLSYILRDEVQSIIRLNNRDVVIVAHSMGGLVAKHLISSLDASSQQRVTKLIMVATPQLGTPNALESLLHGKDIMPTKLDDRILRSLAKNMPGIYALLPNKQYFETNDVEPVVSFYGNGVITAVTDPDHYIGEYGNNIKDDVSMANFIMGWSDNRDDQGFLEDPLIPSKGNAGVYAQVIKERRLINDWQKPSNLSVYQIGGYGQSTTSGIQYYQFNNYDFGTHAHSTPQALDSTIHYSPAKSDKGDETVLLSSAVAMGDDGQKVFDYFADVKSMGLKHSNILDSTQIKGLIGEIVVHGEQISSREYIRSTNPFEALKPTSTPIPTTTTTPIISPTPTTPPVNNNPTISDRLPLAITKNSIYFTSQVNTNGIPSNYYYQYGLTSGFGNTTSSLPVGALSEYNASYYQTGLTCWTKYYYRIVVTNNLGTFYGGSRTDYTSSCSGEPTPTPTPIPTQTPTPTPTPVIIPGSLTLFNPEIIYCDASIAQNRLNWTKSSDADGYRIMRDNNEVGTVPWYENTYLDNAPSGSSPRYVIRAYKGNYIKDSNEVSISTSNYCQSQINKLLPIVVTMPADKLSVTSATLNAQVNPNGSSTNMHYEYGTSTQFGSKTSAKNYGGGTTIENAPYNISITCDNTYYYRAVAQNPYGLKNGDTLSFYKSCGNNTPPTNLVGELDSSSNINLNWQDNSTEEIGFHIYQSINGGSWAIRATLDKDTTSWSTDTQWYVGKFCYHVRGIDTFGKNSDSTNSVCFTLPVPPTPTPVPTPTPTPTPIPTPIPTPTPTPSPSPSPSPKPDPAPPIFDEMAPKTVLFGKTMTFSVLAKDMDTASKNLKYSSVSLPEGANFVGRKFTWKPQKNQIGDHRVIVSVTDGTSVAQQEIAIRVINTAPVFNARADVTGSVKKRIKITVLAKDGNNDSLQYTLVNPPSGATFSGRSMIWVPKVGDAGVYNLEFTATDGIDTVKQFIKLTISDLILSTPTPTPTPSPITVTFQPGPDDGHDTWYSSYFSYGSNHVVDDTRIRPGGFGMNMYAVNRSWTEKYSSDWSPRPTGELISSNLPAPLLNTWYEIDVTNLYNQWQSGQKTNFGLMLEPKSVNNNFNEFYSSDYMDNPSLRPMLVIEQ